MPLPTFLIFTEPASRKSKREQALSLLESEYPCLYQSTVFIEKLFDELAERRQRDLADADDKVIAGAKAVLSQIQSHPYFRGPSETRIIIARFIIGQLRRAMTKDESNQLDAIFGNPAYQNERSRLLDLVSQRLAHSAHLFTHIDRGRSHLQEE